MHKNYKMNIKMLHKISLRKLGAVTVIFDIKLYADNNHMPLNKCSSFVK